MLTTSATLQKNKEEKMKKHFRWGFLVLVLAIALPYASAAGTEQKQVTLVFESFWPATHNRAGGRSPIAEWLTFVEKESAGRIAFERHWGGEPVPAREGLDALSRGTVDMMLLALPYYSGKVGIGEALGLPMSLRTTADLYDLWWYSPAGKIIDDVYRERANVTLLFPFASTSYGIQISKRTEKVRNFEDLKGLKLRAPGGMIHQTMKLLGVTPVLTVAGEYYTAVQRGTIDGGLMPPYAFQAYKMWEVCDQQINPPVMSTTCMFIGMNLDKWNELSAELQKILLPSLSDFGG
jgi:TRAP-type C4-dicarboxylate transport system substrate-binding protein